MSKSKDILIADLSELGLEVTQILPIKYNIQDFTPVVTNIFSYLTGGGILLCLIEGEYTLRFYQSIYVAGLRYPLYTIYAIGIDQSVLVSNNMEMFFENQYIITSGPRVNNDIDSLMLKHLNSLFPYINHVNKNMLYAAASILVWREASEIKRSLTVESILSAVINLKISTPIGDLIIKKNNHLSVPRFIYTVTNGNLVESYSSGNNLSPNPWDTYYIDQDNYYECDWEIQTNEKNLTAQLFLNIILSKEDVNFLELFSAAVSTSSELNDNKNGIGGVLIHNRFLFYDDNDENLSEKLENFITGGKYHLLIGCTTNNCLEKIEPLTRKYKCFLFYPTKYEGGTCFSTIFVLGPIPNQIVATTLNFMNTKSTRKNVVILHTPDDKWDIFKKTFELSISGQFSLSLTIIKKDNEYISYSDLQNIMLAINDGGFIISFLSETPMISFIQLIELYQLSYKLFDIISIRLSPYIIKKKISIQRSIIYYVSGIDLPVDDYLVKSTLSNVKKYVGMDSVTDDSISIIIALNLMVKAIESAGINFPQIKKYLLLTYLNDNNSTMFDKSYYLIRDIYLYKYSYYDAIVEKIAIRSVPDVFNWDLEGNYGKICDNTQINADFEGDSIVNKTSTNILLVISSSGINYNDYRGIYETFEETIAEINLNSVVRDTILFYDVIDDESDTNVCSSRIKEMLNNKNYDVIFTTSSSLCIDAVLSVVNELNIKVFNIGLFGGESCQKNVFHIGIEPSSIEFIIERELNVGNNKFAVVGSSVPAFMKFTTYAEKFLNYLHANLLYEISVDESSSNLDTVAQGIVNIMPEGGIILFFGNINLHIALSKSLLSLGINVDSYKFISFSTAEEAAINNVMPFYSVSHYFNSIETQGNIELINFLKYPLPNDLLPNHYHEAIYSLLFYWVKVLNTYKDIPINKLDKEYYDISYETAVGSMKIDTNNVINRNIYVGYYDGNGNGLFILKSTEDLGRPIIYKTLLNNGYFVCDFNSSEIGSKYKYPSNTIAVMTALTGGDELRGRELVSTALYAIKEINDKGGVLGNKILLEIVNTESNFDNLANLARDTSILPNIRAVFGGLWDDELKIIAPYFNKAKQFYFFSGIALGESCYSYSISSQSTEGQLIKQTRAIITQKVTGYILIYTFHDFSKTALSLISGYLDYASISYIAYEYKLDDSMFINILHDFPDGANIINVGSTWYSLELATKASEYGLNYSKFTFYHYFADEYLLNGSEKSFENHVFFASWFSILGKTEGTKYEKSREFYNKLNKRYKNTIIVSNFAEAIYNSIWLWATGVKETNSFVSADIGKGMVDKKCLFTGDYIKLERNNCFSRVFYSFQIKNGKIVIINSPTGLIEPDSYSQWLPDNRGRFCDWISHSGEYKKEKIIKLAIILEKDYYITAEIYNALFGFDISVTSINNEGGINGNHIIYDVYIVKLNDIYNISLEVSKDDNIKGIFGCLSNECREIILKEAEKNKKLFIYFSDYDGLSFSLYTLQIGLTLYQKMEVTLDYTTKFYKNYYIVIDNSVRYLFLN